MQYMRYSTQPPAARLKRRRPRVEQPVHFISSIHDTFVAERLAQDAAFLRPGAPVDTYVQAALSSIPVGGGSCVLRVDESSLTRRHSSGWLSDMDVRRPHTARLPGRVASPRLLSMRYNLGSLGWA